MCLLPVTSVFFSAPSGYAGMQNVSDLADLVGSGREAREEEKALVEQLQAKTVAYQAAR